MRSIKPRPEKHGGTAKTTLLMSGKRVSEVVRSVKMVVRIVLVAIFHLKNQLLRYTRKLRPNGTLQETTD